ncbi:hypothetical protein ABZT49_02005 [Methylobacterium sp. EM32]|uniref:hypothetical protein n=1 Tax=Methylobacterium sp. EM32 TaxID=3163481 RepID=UPI0033AC1CBA
MPRLLPILVLFAAFGTAPALALDGSNVGRDGGLDVGDTARRSLTVGNGCKATDGAFATDGTQSWQPSCFGVFVSSGIGTKVYATRGVEKDTNGNPSSNGYAPLLVQFQADGSIRRETNGIFVNGDVVGGSVSAAQFGVNNVTGQLISMRQRPGPNGQRPPTVWGHNVDIHIAPGAGNVQTFGVEYDINNFNKDCAPGPTCLSAGIFFNGIGTPNTAWIYSGGGTTNEWSGTVRVNNGTITLLKGRPFDATVYHVRIDGIFYRAHYINANQLVADVPIPNMASAAFTSKNAITHYGIYFQGDNNSSDADALFATTAFTGIDIAGNHHIAFNSSSDAGPYALVTRPGQSVCLNGYAGCLSYDGGATGLRYGGGFLVTNDGNVTLGGGLQASSATAVRLNSPLATPASSKASCAPGDWAHDTDFVYTCVAANTWKRAALSSW